MKSEFKSKRFMPGLVGSIVGAALVSCAVLQSSPAAAAGVRPMFDLSHPAGSPFPSDRFTVRDPRQNTGLRVSLPKPDCTIRVSDCEHIDVLNELDGFNLQPRISVPFTGPIDVNTVSSQSIFLTSLGSPSGSGTPNGRVIGINQIVWDVGTNTLHVEADELLEQHTRYALIITRDLRDAAGDPIDRALPFRDMTRVPDFRDSRDIAVIRYGVDLAIGVARLVAARVIDAGKIAGVSVFTTQSATSTLEKIRDQIKLGTPEAADFNLGPGGTRTVFPLGGVTAIMFRAHTGTGLVPRFANVTIPFAALKNPEGIRPGAVATIAFGKYASPDYRVPGEFIPQIPTRSGVPVVQQTNQLFFNLFLPSGDKPAGGWPVAIFGHGGGNDKNGVMFRAGAMLAAHGIATIGINAVGHGFGPLGTLTVTSGATSAVTFSAGGRGIDQDGNGTIASGEGSLAAPPREIIDFRDGFVQTAADLMQLVRVIEVGMDVDGDSVPDLDPARIYYVGQSAGGNYGTLFLAVEPSVRAGTLTVPGSPRIDNDRLGPARRPAVGSDLASLVPPLLNSPGIATFGGLAVLTPRFDDNLPLRDGMLLTVGLADGTTRNIQSPVVNTVAGAMEIQEYVEKAEWIFQAGSSVAYARHLRKAPLPGLSAKSVIIQFAKGDQTNPNPVTTAILRAGDLADRATFYRHDLAFAENPTLRKNPHVFMPSIDAADVALRPIARGAQEQIAVFLASDGQDIIHSEPKRFFEVPVVLPLPEDLSFIP